MPNFQVEKVMQEALGSDWRSKYASFEDKPFAAASIGQVSENLLINVILNHVKDIIRYTKEYYIMEQSWLLKFNIQVLHKVSRVI